MDWLIGADRRDAGIERIYAAAAASAAARGLDRLNIDEVAASVGCSRATVYRHVGGKQALRDGVLARAVMRVGQEIAQAVAGHTGSERIAAAVLSALRVVRADPLASGVVRAGALVDFDSPRLSQAAAELTGTTIRFSRTGSCGSCCRCCVGRWLTKRPKSWWYAGTWPP